MFVDGALGTEHNIIQTMQVPGEDRQHPGVNLQTCFLVFLAARWLVVGCGPLLAAPDVRETWAFTRDTADVSETLKCAVRFVAAESVTTTRAHWIARVCDER